MRKLAPLAVVLVLFAALFTLAQLPQASAQQRAAVASQFHFASLPIAEPPGLPHATIRDVNPAYRHIQAWISSVGAACFVFMWAGFRSIERWWTLFSRL